MFRWLVPMVLFAVLVPGHAQAASPYAKASLARCDRDLNEAMFSGRMSSYRRSAKMQMRFTLQALTPDEPRWRKVDARASASGSRAVRVREVHVRQDRPGAARPGEYRAVVHFRWRNARGKLIRSERAVSGICRQPDSRPDLVVRNVKADSAGYVAVVFNRAEAAGAFDVRFVRDGVLLGSARVAGLEPQTAVDVFLPVAVRAGDAAGGGRRPAFGGRRVQRVQRLRQRVLLSQSATVPVGPGVLSEREVPAGDDHQLAVLGGSAIRSANGGGYQRSFAPRSTAPGYPRRRATSACNSPQLVGVVRLGPEVDVGEHRVMSVSANTGIWSSQTARHSSGV